MDQKSLPNPLKIDQKISQQIDVIFYRFLDDFWWILGAKLGHVGAMLGQDFDKMVKKRGQDGQDRPRWSKMELKRGKIRQHNWILQNNFVNNFVRSRRRD